MHIENIKVGQWVVVTKKRERPIPDQTYPSEISEVRHVQSQEFEPTGIPAKVKAISPPFVLTSPIVEPRALCAISTDMYVISSVTDSYIRAFKTHTKRYRPNEEESNSPYLD